MRTILGLALFLTASTVSLAAGLGACSSSSSPTADSTAAPSAIPTNANPGESKPSMEKPKDPTTQMTVGIDAEDFRSQGYQLDSLEVGAKIDGLVAAQMTFDTEAGALFPREVHLVAPQAKPDALVEVSVIAKINGNVVVLRQATAHFVPGQTKLLYMFLEVRCNTFPLLGGGGPSGPVCMNDGETCIAGKCRAEAVPDLPDYAADWATNPPSSCGTGAPELTVGKGETDFAPITSGDTLPMECGPQGGHHVWLSLRMKSLRQIGTVVTVSAAQPGGGQTVPPTAFVYTWAPTDVAGTCELTGLRFQLDVLAPNYMDFLGKPLDVTVEAKDKGGHDLTSVAHIMLPAMATGTFCH